MRYKRHCLNAPQPACPLSVMQRCLSFYSWKVTVQATRVQTIPPTHRLKHNKSAPITELRPRLTQMPMRWTVTSTRHGRLNSLSTTVIRRDDPWSSWRLWRHSKRKVMRCVAYTPLPPLRITKKTLHVWYLHVHKEKNHNKIT